MTLVDGNGVLHPQGFGLASHFGVLRGIPTIGIGKTFLHVDGLTKCVVKRLMAEAREDDDRTHNDVVKLTGKSGKVQSVWHVCIEETTLSKYDAVD